MKNAENKLEKDGKKNGWRYLYGLGVAGDATVERNWTDQAMKNKKCLQLGYGLM